MLKLES